LPLGVDGSQTDAPAGMLGFGCFPALTSASTSVGIKGCRGERT
jgi:hypothetical protein